MEGASAGNKRKKLLTDSEPCYVVRVQEMFKYRVREEEGGEGGKVRREERPKREYVGYGMPKSSEPARVSTQKRNAEMGRDMMGERGREETVTLTDGLFFNSRDAVAAMEVLPGVLAQQHLEIRENLFGFTELQVEHLQKEDEHVCTDDNYNSEELFDKETFCNLDMETIYNESMLEDPPMSTHGRAKVPGDPSNVIFVESGSGGGGGGRVGERNKDIGNVVGGILHVDLNMDTMREMRLKRFG